MRLVGSPGSAHSTEVDDIDESNIGFNIELLDALEQQGTEDPGIVLFGLKCVIAATPHRRLTGGTGGAATLDPLSNQTAQAGAMPGPNMGKKRPSQKRPPERPESGSKRVHVPIPSPPEGTSEGSPEHVAYMLCHGDRGGNPEYQEAARLVRHKGISALHIRQYYSELTFDQLRSWLDELVPASSFSMTTRTGVDSIFRDFIYDAATRQRLDNGRFFFRSAEVLAGALGEEEVLCDGVSASTGNREELVIESMEELLIRAKIPASFVPEYVHQMAEDGITTFADLTDAYDNGMIDDKMLETWGFRLMNRRRLLLVLRENFEHSSVGRELTADHAVHMLEEIKALGVREMEENAFVQDVYDFSAHCEVLFLFGSRAGGLHLARRLKQHLESVLEWDNDRVYIDAVQLTDRI